MGHSELVFLVDHRQAQVLYRNIPLQDAVGPDADIDRTRGEAGDDRLLIRGTAEARQHLDPDRIRREPLGERGEVLLGEDRGRHEDGDLAARLNHLESCPQRHLGLAVPDVPTH